MRIEWETALRPKAIQELALYPLLKETLLFYEKTRSFSNLLMIGDTGLGKTSAAKILANHSSFSVMNVDCTQVNTASQIKHFLKDLSSIPVDGTRRIIIMDEFHDIKRNLQTMFNIPIEETAEINTFIFCVNDRDKVAIPIISRTQELKFDVGEIKGNKGEFVMHPYTGMTKQQWMSELERVGRLTAKKSGYSVSKKHLSAVFQHPIFLEPRKFIRALEQQLKKDEAQRDG